jgi:hypothetical protein
MPCAYEYFDAQPGAVRVDMAAGGYLLGGAPQSHQSFRRAGADPFGPFRVRAQYPLDGAAGNRGQLGDAIDAQTFLAHQQ